MRLRLTRAPVSMKLGLRSHPVSSAPADKKSRPWRAFCFSGVLRSPERGCGTGRGRIRPRPAQVCRYFLESSRGCKKALVNFCAGRIGAPLPCFASLMCHVSGLPTTGVRIETRRRRTQMLYGSKKGSRPGGCRCGNLASISISGSMTLNISRRAQ